MKKVIKNENELEFVVFCIESIADELNVSGEKIYFAFEKNKIIDEYLVPNYEVLHTQSKDYIVNDVIHLLKERGVVIC